MTTFELFPDLPEVFHAFHLTNDRHPDVYLTQDIQFYVIQLTDKISPDRFMGLCKDLVDWISLLNFPHTTEEQMKTALLDNPGVAKTGQVLVDYISDEKRRDLEDIELGGFMRGEKKDGEEVWKKKFRSC